MAKDERVSKRVLDSLRHTANKVAVTVSNTGYNLKTPAMFDLYEGEAYGLNWDDMKNVNPFRLVFQATVGAHGRHRNDKPDYAVADFVSQSKSKNLKYGLYHLLVPSDIQRQADFYCSTVDSLGGLGNMMPIADVEVNWVRGKDWAADVKAWLDLVEGHFGQKPLIYTSKYYWSYLNDKFGNPPFWTRDYPGWFAGYPFVPYLDSNVLMPHTYQANGFVDWAAWQYYDKSRSIPPRGYDKFPANDSNLVSGWFEAYLNQKYP